MPDVAPIVHWGKMGRRSLLWAIRDLHTAVTQISRTKLPYGKMPTWQHLPYILIGTLKF